MAKSTSKRPAKARKGKRRRLVSLPGGDGAHYTPLAGGKWLRSRSSDGMWAHTLTATPAIASSGSAGPGLASTSCPVDGNDYINLGNGKYLRSTPNPDGTFTQVTVDKSKVPPECQST